MVHIAPFQGIRYNPAKIDDWAKVTAPPYDVISPTQQAQLHQNSPYNIVRLILGEKHASDTDQDNVYTRAHNTLEAWLSEQAVLPEAQPAIYAYRQSWDEVTRSGFIARLKLEPYETGQILPHEFTLGGPKADRLALFKATGSILSPIFCLYDDPQLLAEAALFSAIPEDAVTVIDPDNVEHTFWPVTQVETVSAIQHLLAQQPVLIADGHHRFETAVAYQQWRNAQSHRPENDPEEKPWDYTMAFFTNMADDGLRVYPTHRVFDSWPNGWDADKLKTSVESVFEAVSDENALFWLQVHGQAKQGYQLKPGVDATAIPAPLRDLDVALLDYFVFEQAMGHSANDLKQAGYLHFIRDEAETLETLKQPNSLVFWVNAPDVNQVKTICQSGYRMPQKSTYFYPKLLSGLVLYYYGV